MKAHSFYLLFKFKGHAVLEKDWGAPVDISVIICELLAVRANQNLASIGLKF